MAKKEYMFPFVTVVECEQKNMIASIGSTLVATALTQRPLPLRGPALAMMLSAGRTVRRRAICWARFGTFTAPAGEVGIGGKNKIKGVTKATSAVKFAQLDGNFELDYGGTLDGVTVAWEEVRIHGCQHSSRRELPD